jgi:hypothetical protein
MFPHLRSNWLRALGMETEAEQLGFYIIAVGSVRAALKPLREAFWLDLYIREKDPVLKIIYAANTALTNAHLDAAEKYLPLLRKQPRKFAVIPIAYVGFHVFHLLKGRFGGNADNS